MKLKKDECCSDNSQKCCCHKGGNNGAIYGLGMIGALFYFLQDATTFGVVILGIIKSIFWPGVLLFEILTRLQL